MIPTGTKQFNKSSFLIYIYVNAIYKFNWIRKCALLQSWLQICELTLIEIFQYLFFYANTFFINVYVTLIFVYKWCWIKNILKR